MLRLARLLETAPGNAADLKRAIRSNLVAWSPFTTRLINLLPHSDEVYLVAFSPDGRTALTLSPELTARLWDAATGEPCGEPFGTRARSSPPPLAPTAGWWPPAGWTARPGSGKSRAAGRWANRCDTRGRCARSPSAPMAEGS